MIRAFRVTLRGRVQGVAFRWYARDEASRRGVTGWVRNLADGRVEVFCEGEEEPLARFLEFLSHGPPTASVDDVERAEADVQGHADFEIVR